MCLHQFRLSKQTDSMSEQLSNGSRCWRINILAVHLENKLDYNSNTEVVRTEQILLPGESWALSCLDQDVARFSSL